MERPDDLRYAIQEARRRSANREGVLGEVLDRGEYAVMGHSFGSHTAMVLGGGRLDYSGFWNTALKIPVREFVNILSKSLPMMSTNMEMMTHLR